MLREATLPLLMCNHLKIKYKKYKLTEHISEHRSWNVVLGIIFYPVSEPSSALSDEQLSTVSCLVVDDGSCSIS
jgi:hypothetical protein